MKTLFTTAIFCFSFLIGMGQNAIEKHFSDLSSQKDITKVSVSGAMFQLAENFESESEEEKAFMQAAEKIEGLTVLIREQANDAKTVMSRVESELNGEFDELIRFEEQDTEAVFYVKESGGIITEMIGFVAETDEWILINLWGEIDLKQMNTIFSQMEVGSSLSGFDSEVADAASQISFYPNPIGKNANGRLQIPEGFVGSRMLIYNLDGRVVRENRIAQMQQEVKLSGLPSGTYVIKVLHENTQVFNEKIIIQ